MDTNETITNHGGATVRGAAAHRADDVTRTTVRLPAELADALRTYVYLTRKSGNDAMVRALTAFLEGEGRKEMIAASGMDTIKRYGAVLDKLGDS